MEVYAQGSKYISKIIVKYQNKEINTKELNKNILINTIFTYNYLRKKKTKNKKINKEQNEIFQSFYIREQKQEENEKELLSKIKDRKSRKIVLEAIKEQREDLLRELSSKKNLKVFNSPNFDSYIAPKNISLSLNFELNKNNKNKSQKLLTESNIEISYINPNFNDKIKIISNDFIETSFLDNIQEYDINIDNNNEENNKKINIEKENDIFLEMLNEEDEFLFYDEKIQKNEKISLVNTWGNKLIKDDIIYDFEELKQKNKKNKITKNDNFFFVLKQENLIKKEMNTYLKSNHTILYDEISQKDHFHEFSGYLSEKIYKMYMKKMNYSYLILMLLSYFDFEQFSNNYEFLDDSKAVVIFIKKILLFCGISNNKIFESLIYYVNNFKGELNFEKYLSFFLPIFELSDKYQSYKYNFLLYLVKKSGYNTISMSNYRIFCNLIKSKLIYEEDTCDDIIGKMIPIIKVKYPKDDLDNLNYQHVNIILEFLVNYEYGD